MPWFEPQTAENLIALLSAAVDSPQPSQDRGITAPVAPHPPLQAAHTGAESAALSPHSGANTSETHLTPAGELFATVRSLIERMAAPKTEAEIADALNVLAAQAKK